MTTKPRRSRSITVWLYSWRYAARSEALQGLQASLLEESIAADIEGIEQELQSLQPTPAPQPTRQQARSCTRCS